MLGHALPQAAADVEQDLPPHQRLAEEVARADAAAHRLAGAVEGALGLEPDLEAGQHVALDADAAARPVAVVGPLHPRLDAVGAEVDLVGQLEVQRGHAEARGLPRPGEDHRAPGILDPQLHPRPRHRPQVHAAQGQRAHVDRLTGLIERLVRGEQDPAARVDLHLGDAPGLPLGRDDVEAELVGAGLDPRHVEAEVRRARAVGALIHQVSRRGSGLSALLSALRLGLL